MSKWEKGSSNNKNGSLKVKIIIIIIISNNFQSEGEIKEIPCSKYFKYLYFSLLVPD